MVSGFIFKCVYGEEGGEGASHGVRASALMGVVQRQSWNGGHNSNHGVLKVQ